MQNLRTTFTFDCRYHHAVLCVGTTQNERMNLLTSHLPSTRESVIAATGHILSSWGRISWFDELGKVKAGGFGSGNPDSPLSIGSTSGMLGLSMAWSWTQRSPICAHLITSDNEAGSDSDESINSSLLPSFHSSHACNNTKISFPSKY